MINNIIFSIFFLYFFNTFQYPVLPYTINYFPFWPLLHCLKGGTMICECDVHPSRARIFVNSCKGRSLTKVLYYDERLLVTCNWLSPNRYTEVDEKSFPSYNYYNVLLKRICECKVHPVSACIFGNTFKGRSLTKVLYYHEGFLVTYTRLRPNPLSRSGW